MRASLLIETLTARAVAHMEGKTVRPALVQGPPGIGKTQIGRHVAQSLSIGFKALHAPLMPPEDYGMPHPQEGELVFTTPGDKLPFVDSHYFPEDHGIVLVDEVAQCEQPQQKIWANIFQERELHGRKLKPGWMFIATGNRMEDRAGAARILSHFNDRFTTYDLEPNVDDWCAWALTQGGVRPEVVAFIRFKPGLLIGDGVHAGQFNPQAKKNATPRAWAEGVSSTIDVVPDAALLETIKGDVGEGPAAEFTGFLRTFRELPNPDLVIAQADSHPVPDEMHVLYALSGALAHRANEKNFADVIRFAVRMPAEFMVLTLRDAVQRDRALEETDAYTRWCVREGARALSDR